MKTIGLIGGMSWESSLVYYRLLNETVKEKLGGLHSAKTILYSVDFAEIEEMQREGRWAEAGERMAQAAQGLEAAGAERPAQRRGLLFGRQGERQTLPRWRSVCREDDEVVLRRQSVSFHGWRAAAQGPDLL
ncbi:hypothetical protein D478_13218 [Brevibacillus agri BAB-2500]|nr:hypothetical protein D478_13218 [Brevibacillus agri BAB-2500]